MKRPILHHYPASTHAEKIRLILGYKDMVWKSVDIPPLMPKPDVVALTGGYRRTPILQLGADVYCDTALIVRVLERLKPSPTLYPYGDTLAVLSLAHFAESVLFNVAVPIAFQPESTGVFFPGAGPEFLDRFREDRSAMRRGGTVRRGPIGECRALYAHYAPLLDAQFADGRPFLLGSSPCAADFACYHPLWPLGRVPALKGLLEPYARISAWMGRMQAIGHGRPTALSSAQALEAARSAKPAPVHGAAFETEGHALGDTVEVLPVDYALDAVRGELLECSADEIALRRSDERAGTVVVHFPRAGYQLRTPQ